MEFLSESLLSSSSDSGLNEDTSGEAPLNRFNSNDRKSAENRARQRAEAKEELFMRALGIASRQENAAGKFMKAPFLVLSTLVGLWPGSVIPPRCMLSIGVIINTYIFTGAIFIWKICATLPYETSEKLTGLLCYGSSNYNRTKQIWSSSYLAIQWVHILFTIAQLSGYFLMAACILRALPRREDAITLKQAFHLLTRKQWLNLNLHILISFFVYLAVMSLHIFRVTKYFPHNTFNISTEVENVVFWVYLGTPCWIFAVITKALESLVDACFYELKEARGDIDAAIKIYSELCRQIFSTSRTFKYWFVIHWFGFGVTFAVDAAMGVMMVSESNPYVSWIFISTWLFIIIHTFLYPTVCAASLTSKCADLLERLNVLEADEWDSGHPLQIRRNMNEFLVFANQIRCGFRVGRIIFNNGLAWLSVFFGIFGLVMKVI